MWVRDTQVRFHAFHRPLRALSEAGSAPKQIARRCRWAHHGLALRTFVSAREVHICNRKNARSSLLLGKAERKAR